uniref:Uncharacterized protein n=1 Tax=Ditylenchus dipsaci TaxID=166011 RepID=A0A915DUT4_9BILA
MIQYLETTMKKKWRETDEINIDRSTAELFIESTSNGKSNDELVDNLVKNEVVKKKEIELVMRLVDRVVLCRPPSVEQLIETSLGNLKLVNLKVEKGMSFLKHWFWHRLFEHNGWVFAG